MIASDIRQRPCSPAQSHPQIHQANSRPIPGQIRPTLQCRENRYSRRSAAVQQDNSVHLALRPPKLFAGITSICGQRQVGIEFALFLRMSRSDRPANHSDESVSNIVRRIGRYLRANPLAGDTKDGITQWWLGLPPAAGELVQHALGVLEAAGVVEAVRAMDGRVRYRRAAIPDVEERLDRIISGPNQAG
jgi:hypothetical protein